MSASSKPPVTETIHSIDILIGNQRYELKGTESEEHLREVAELVRRRVEGMKKKSAGLTLQKAAMLAAFDFASDLIKARKKSSDYRSTILAKAQGLLERAELTLDSKRPS